MVYYSSIILNGCATGGTPLVKDKTVRNTKPAAWQVIPRDGSANGNNGNKSNGNAVRPVVALSEQRKNGWMLAYRDCLRHKMMSGQCVLYRLHDEDLLRLMEECESRHYVPDISTCFVVRYPKPREIFAASFRDRIVQHWICRRIEPLFEERFTLLGNVSWNCRKGCGTQAAVCALRHDLLDITQGYTRTAWVGRFDIRSFFTQIDIRILESLVTDFVRKHYHGEDQELLLYLLAVTIRHRPQDHCARRGDTRLCAQLPQEKSLFHAERHRGLPIGNITSQLLANFYLSYLDEYILGLCAPLGARYERFADDFVIVGRDKEDVLSLRNSAATYLQAQLNLEMHKQKVYIQEARKGVAFVGSVIKQHRTYAGKRTVSGLVRALRTLNRHLTQDKTPCLLEAEWLEGYVNSLNSYLGQMKAKQSYGIKRKLIARHGPLLFKRLVANGHFDQVKIKKQYTLKYQLLIKECYE